MTGTWGSLGGNMIDHAGPELQAGESDSSEGSRKPRSLCEQERPGSVSDAARTRAGPDGGSRELAHHPIYYHSYLFIGDVPQGLGHPPLPCPTLYRQPCSRSAVACRGPVNSPLTLPSRPHLFINSPPSTVISFEEAAR